MIKNWDLEALQNGVNYIKLEGLTITEEPVDDKRKKAKMFKWS